MLSFIRENLKKILLALIGWVFFAISVYQCERNDSRIDDIKNIVNTQNESIRTFKDEANRWHSVATATELQHHEAVKMYIKSDTNLNRVIKDFTTVKKSLKNLEYLGITTLSSNYNATHQIILDTVYIQNKDTLPAKYIHGVEPRNYFSYQAIVYNNDIKDLQIQSNDTINVAVTKWRKWFLGKKRFRSEVISSNPYTKITHQKTLLID
jgi:hypothetical protein